MSRPRDHSGCGVRAFAHPTWGNVLLVLAVLLIACLAVSFGGLESEANAANKNVITCQRANLTPHQAIDCIWPRRSRAAAHRIAECESTASAPERIARHRGLGRWARNGKYAGIFQMGPNERRAHGWYSIGAPAIVQVRSALSLYHSRGWSPWSCRA